MIQITVEGRRASVSNKELLTSGSAGIEVKFTFDSAWDGIYAKRAVFRVGDDGEKIDIALDNSLTCVIPPETLATADEVLFAGVYGADQDGYVIIPTIWTSLGVVRPGVDPENPRDYQPTPSIVDQIHTIANRAEQTATDAMTLVEEGLSDLSALESTVQTNEEQRQDNEAQRIADFNTMMQSARAYVLEPSVSAIVYDPNEESGSQVFPTSLQVNAYYIDNEGDRGGFTAPFFEVSIIPETGTPTTTTWETTSAVSLTLPQTITPGTTVQARIWKDNSLGLPMTLAEITIPVISDGLNGYSGTDGIVYTLEPSVNAIVYDPNAALGERISPTSLTVNMYEKRGTSNRIAKLVSRLAIEINGIASFDTGVSSFTKELGNLTPNSTVRAFAINDGKTLATITIPIVSHGKKGLQGDPGVSPTVTVETITDGHRVTITDKDHPAGQSFDVMDGEDGASDAGEVTYDPMETYESGTAGAALNDLNRHLSDVESAFLRKTNPADNIVVDLIFTQGGYYNSTDNDNFVVDAEFGYTDKIPITAGKTYFINTPAAQYISFYDSNGDFLSGLAGISATAPSGSAFIRLSMKPLRQAVAKLTVDAPYTDYVSKLQNAIGDISFKNYPETLTEVLTDHSMQGSGYVYTGANDVNIDPSYGAVIEFTNRSSAVVSIIGYLTQNGNNVTSMTTGNVSLQAGQTYIWDIPAVTDKPYGSWESFFSANYVGICINNVNSANITVTVKQRGNIFVDGLRREKRTVICDPTSTGGGIFNNIQKAINWLKAHYNVATTPCIVYLMNGTYTLNYVSSRNAVINKGANRISIVGESRDGVKLVLTSTPAQNNKIIEHGGPSIIENVSFFNLWNADGSTPSYANNSYCIHNDIGFTTDEVYDTVVKNCYVYSEAFAPIGAGLWKNQKQRYIDVEAVFNSLDERPNGYNQWAPIYIHGPSQPNQPNCSVEIDGCTCIAQKGTMAIVLPNVPDRTPYTEIPVSIRRTIGTTTGSTITNVSKATHDLQPDSALNNVDAWNY